MQVVCTMLIEAVTNPTAYIYREREGELKVWKPNAQGVIAVRKQCTSTIVNAANYIITTWQV